jgi:hypothetical protein
MDSSRHVKRRDNGLVVAARTARKLVLPTFVLTGVAQSTDAEAAAVCLSSEGQPDGVTYYTRPLSTAEGGARRDGRPSWVKYQFNLLPVVLDKNGAPWAEANVYLLSRVENELNPSMATLTSIADGLVAYLQFLDDNELDWADFPQQRLSRPTYRYYGHLRYAIGAGEVSASTAKRRMSAVVSFYRWLRQEGVLSIKNEPWKESERFIRLKDQHGLDFHKKVRTTDIAVRTPQQRDPYDGRIDGGGRLRPLPASEQMWLADALAAADNPEMTLIHLVSLLTGARIQTVLTLQARHVLTDTALVSAPELRLPVGPGTGVDTKNDKRLVLAFPMWFYEQLQGYANSTRAANRREKAEGGNHPEQYLFLSQRGEPLYRSKADARVFDAENRCYVPLYSDFRGAVCLSIK